jgi:SAM-dependent methyltransferase
MGSATRQGRLWGTAARDWPELQEPLALPLWEAMLDAAAVGPGTRVLDAGCGAGGASVRAAPRGAHVNGLDATEALRAISLLESPSAIRRATSCSRRVSGSAAGRSAVRLSARISLGAIWGWRDDAPRATSRMACSRCCGAASFNR